jgi:putative transposase
MGYSKGCHITFHHRYHIVWAPKYRYKVLIGDVRLRVREIIRQVCAEMGVTIINGALSREHIRRRSPLAHRPWLRVMFVAV